MLNEKQAILTQNSVSDEGRFIFHSYTQVSPNKNGLYNSFLFNIHDQNSQGSRKTYVRMQTKNKLQEWKTKNQVTLKYKQTLEKWKEFSLKL